MPPHEDTLREIHRLTLENNKMLHKMRRGAFVKSIIQFIIYAALLAAPIWFYMQYLSPIVNQMMQTVQQIQGTGAQAQAQFSGFQDAWQAFAEKFKSSGSTGN